MLNPELTSPRAPSFGHHAEPLLYVQNLVKHFPIQAGVFRRDVGKVHAVDGVSFSVETGEALGLVGESGCGKSTTGLTIMGLLEPTTGSIFFQGRDSATVRRRRERGIRDDMQMVFQDPLNSLNPRLSAARSVAEPLRYHGWSRPRRRARIAELFEQVGLHRNTLGRYPAEMSGGQRQRVGLARALALHPKLLILDEPVSSLDVSVQAQILNLLQDLQHELGLSYLFISHNLSVVRYLCDRVAVMYLGKIVEIGSREEVYESPMHPYTQALLSAVPLPDPPEPGRSRGIVLTGELPSPANPPSGCRFRTRCWKSAPTCAEREPALIPRAGSASHAVACHFVETVSRSQAARGLGGSPDAAAKAADV